MPASSLRAVLLILTAAAPSPGQQPSDQVPWVADTQIEIERSRTDMGLGAVQGVVVRDGFIYAYGDRMFDIPRIGVIRQYTMDLEPTGRELRLTREGKPLIVHPTGLTWNERWGTFLGDTVPGVDTQKKALIYRIDWERAWNDGNLDNAVLAVIEDDAAINGCRPTFIELDGTTYLATADYGSIRPEIRLYEIPALLEAGRSSAPGVVAHRILSGPFNQNLHWDNSSGTLTCVQNITEGKGWRLDVVDLKRAVADGRASGPGVRRSLRSFPDQDELEGYWPIDQDHVLMAIARRRDNLIRGRLLPLEAAVPAAVTSAP